MVKLLFILLLSLQSYIFVEGTATVKKINWQDGKIIEQEEYKYLTNFTVSEKDSIVILGNRDFKIETINATDSVVIYTLIGVEHKEFVYDYNATFTQKNIKWRSHGLETWFQYKLLNNKNEFEFGG